MVLVDTSVWSLALRRKPEHLGSTESSIVTELAELIREGRARLIGLIRQELLSGIKTIQQYEKLRIELRTFPDEQVVTDDYESAAKASNDCKARGVTVSVVDALICSMALRRNLSIFTTDPDFLHLAKVLPIKLHMPRR
jgi:predicted nucleic acid-binding protein